MWNCAVRNALAPEDICVESPTEAKVIKNGEFLDTFDTIAFKQTQIGIVSGMFSRGEIRDGDTFFVPDIFYPGIEAIKYMSELSGIKVNIASFNHAGRADQDDFVQRLNPWADSQEQAWHDLADLVFVGSEYQARRVREKFHPKELVVSGAVWDKGWMDEKCEGIDRTKEDYIIFPHRPCKEKRFDFFIDIARKNPSLRFVITSCGNSRLRKEDLPDNVDYRSGLTKRQYFEVFARAKGYLTTAYQETFGYTVQEAIYFGCQIVCPEYACYPEYVADPSRLTFDEMSRPGALEAVYRERGAELCKSVQHPDNAPSMCELIRQL